MVGKDPIPQLAAREKDSHKGDFGRALLIGGSRGMTGAIALAGMATLRSGAGLVTLAVPDICLQTVAAWDPSYMTRPFPSDAEGRFAGDIEGPMFELTSTATAGACGPGLGRSDALCSLVRRLYREITKPLVFDADALNALAQHPEGLASPGGPRVLTPHPGEFERLTGTSRLDRSERENLAVELAALHEVVIVLKGHRTLVTDGQRLFHNETGNPGMATGGSGDVLTGVITALLCQGLGPLDAARLGVHAHGLAGDLTAARYSMVGMTARDIVESLPYAWQKLS